MKYSEIIMLFMSFCYDDQCNLSVLNGHHRTKLPRIITFLTRLRCPTNTAQWAFAATPLLPRCFASRRPSGASSKLHADAHDAQRCLCLRQRSGFGRIAVSSESLYPHPAGKISLGTRIQRQLAVPRTTSCRGAIRCIQQKV
jgi:hypothetical protein